MSERTTVDRLIAGNVTKSMENWHEKQAFAEEIAARTRLQLPDLLGKWLGATEVETNRARIGSAVMRTIELQRNLPHLAVLIDPLSAGDYEQLFNTKFWFGSEDILPLYRAGEKDRNKESEYRYKDYTIEGVARSAFIFHLLQESLPEDACNTFKTIILKDQIPFWKKNGLGNYDALSETWVKFFRPLSDDDLQKIEQTTYFTRKYLNRMEEMGTEKMKSRRTWKEGEAGMEFLEKTRESREGADGLLNAVHSFSNGTRLMENALYAVITERKPKK